MEARLSAGENLLHNKAIVIVTDDIAIGVDAVVGKPIGLYCKEFDCCFIEVVKMSCLPNFTA